jgi:hypothetical protein
MDRAAFAAYLEDRGLESAGRLAETAERFAEYAGDGAPADSLDAFSRLLIEEGDNTFEVYRALALYGRFIGDDRLASAILSFLDGAEALGNLFDRLGDELGPTERDRVFAGIDLPPLGTPATALPAYTERVMVRLGREVDPAVTEGILSGCLRDFDDAWFAEARAHYEEHRDVDALSSRGQTLVRPGDHRRGARVRSLPSRDQQRGAHRRRRGRGEDPP